MSRISRKENRTLLQKLATSPYNKGVSKKSRKHGLNLCWYVGKLRDIGYRNEKSSHLSSLSVVFSNKGAVKLEFYHMSITLSVLAQTF